MTAALATFVPRDYDIFVGLDVDQRSMAITFTDHGTMQKSLKLPYSATQLLNYTEKHFLGQRLAFVYEAGPTGFGLHDELRAAHQFCLVVSPSMVPQAPRKKVKTNRLDSKKLSEGLRGGQLQGIHVPAQSYRELRHLVQLRDTQVAQLKATKQRIKSLLLYEGIPFPEAHGKWTVPALRELDSTGDKENRGEITRIGDKRLRSKLIQCAWIAIRKDPELRAFYRRVYERQPQKVAARKAIVAVARKLTTRMYAVLKQQRPFVIRTDISVAPLTTEETVGLGERLDVRQNQHP
jgi:transposase